MIFPQLNKDTVINNSVKKFFIENLVDVEGIHVVFDRTMSPPANDDVSQWVFIDIMDYAPGHLNRKMVYVYCFSKDDLEGIDLSNLIDRVMSYLYDDSLMIYDDDLTTLLTGARITLDPHSRTFTTKDNTKMRYIPFTLTWGGVW